jgi:hypothetical protein
MPEPTKQQQYQQAFAELYFAAKQYRARQQRYGDDHSEYAQRLDAALEAVDKVVQ